MTKRHMPPLLFSQVDFVNNKSYEIELSKAEIDHKQSIADGFLIFIKRNLENWDATTNFQQTLKSKHVQSVGDRH